MMEIIDYVISVYVAITIRIRAATSFTFVYVLYFPAPCTNQMLIFENLMAILCKGQEAWAHQLSNLCVWVPNHSKMV